ncbi:mechanosensitive ion channel family protein [Candidatus Latescibacterota bacterium]
MQNISDWIHEITLISDFGFQKLLLSLVIILVLWVIRFTVIRLLISRTEDIRSRYLWQKITKYTAFIIGILLISRVWLEAFHEITTFLGFLAAGLAIALKDIVTNVAGWFFLIWVRPLSVGDRIQIGGHSGDVIDVSLFHFTLLEIGNWVDSDQSTGRIITIPNGMIFTQTFANYSKGFQYIWNEIPVLVTFESNWEKAKDILFTIAQKRTENLSSEAKKGVKEASTRFMIFYSKLTPTVYTTVKESGVLLTIRYLCKPRNRRDSEQSIWEDILKAFSKCDDIELAYPTRRIYNNTLEGKPETIPDKQ